MHRRVVITGLGVIAPNGIGKEEFWRANVSGCSGIGHITRIDASLLPSQIAGEVLDFAADALGVTGEESRTVDRGTQFGIAAATMALQDAQLLHMSEEERDTTGVFMGAAMAALEEGEKLWIRLTGCGSHPLQYSDDKPIVATLLMTHSPASAIASHHQLHGPCMVISTGCSAGGDAIGEAFLAIQNGQAERMIAGGSDAVISFSGMDVFGVMGAMSTRNDSPQRASRPYDRDRDGFVMGEGAGVVVLEEREAAFARNAYIYAEVLAFATNCNAHHMTALPPDGAPLQRLLRQIMEAGQITAEQIEYINPHGSSTPSNEAAETVAYKSVFGEHAYAIPISATKSMIGHTQGAASAIEAVVTTLVLDRQIIPPTINQENPDPQCDLDYVPNVARHATVNVALTHSSGFGGVNSALLLARPEWVDANW